MRHRNLVPLFLAVATLAACDIADPTDPAELRVAPPAEALSAVPGVTEVVGETGPGSTYALLKPANWNGELVVYAHGYVQPFFPVGLTMEVAWLRDWMLGQGFAVAYSSYSETGYAVKDGAQRTHQLNGLFTETFEEPARTYLVGLSMGGLIATQLSERFGPQYDGTLTLCGVMGGGKWNADYVATFRVLFDFFYPGVLPGTLYDAPPGYIVAPGSPAANAIAGAILANPIPAFVMAGLEQVRLAYASPTELVTGFVHVLGYQVNGANAMTERLHGHGFFDNTEIWYSGSGDDAALNAGVQRYAADPAAVNYLEHWYTPNGGISSPFVTLHTTRDPLVPVRGLDLFADAVAAAGNSDLLLQRPSTDAFGHCAFNGTDVLGAFGTLVQWVRTNQRPGA